jgi:hypothetical protein
MTRLLCVKEEMGVVTVAAEGEKLSAARGDGAARCVQVDAAGLAAEKV